MPTIEDSVKKRRSILTEIISSERTYQADLVVMIKFYKDPLTFRAKQFISNSLVQNFSHPVASFKEVPQLALQDVNLLFANLEAIV